MKITITLQDDENGQVQVEEVRHLHHGEQEEAVTASSALADEMLAVLDQLGDAETVLDVSLTDLGPIPTKVRELS